MKLWKKRFIHVLIFLTSIIIGVIIILKTFNDNILFFYSPTDLIERSIKIDEKVIRVGGIVKEGSINKVDKMVIEFIITDNKNELIVRYQGILPNLFKEKQGTVALGKLIENNKFMATELLAKHDENYTPKEVIDILK